MSTKDFVIRKGKTFSHVLRWESPTFVYRPIDSIPQKAPLRLKVPGHGCPNGWRVEIQSVKGMKELNEIKAQVTVVDADHVELNAINAEDFKPYSSSSSGFLVFRSPIDMTGMSARMAIKDKVGGTELLRLDTTNDGLAIDAAECSITIHISADETAALMWKRGVYDLEIVDSLGVVHELLSGKVSVAPEVTT